MSVSSDSQINKDIQVEPRCRHFGECGGCRLQDTAYEEQVRRKAVYLGGLLERAGWLAPVQVHPSPDPWYYRNKMEFAFQDVFPVPPKDGDPLLLGLKRRNRWDKVLNIEECYLMAPEIPKLIAAVHEWARAERLEPYNLHKQVGFLRHLVVREGKNTGERMVNLLTTKGDLPKKSFVEAVRSAFPADTILRGVHEGRSDVAIGQELEVLHGTGYIHEKALGKTLRISPYSFFQTNTKGAELLYGMLRDCVRHLEPRPKNLLDLFCGGGGITLAVADLAERVMGVEVVEPAVEDARRNAAANGVKNADFMASKVEDILPGLAAQKVEVDAVIADPPRSGLHPRAVSALKEMSPPWLIYVSCNPKALIEDIRRLSEVYDLRSVEGIDLFPHTDHLEAVALLRCVYY